MSETKKNENYCKVGKRYCNRKDNELCKEVYVIDRISSCEYCNKIKHS